jgi:hypothetical protein
MKKILLITILFLGFIPNSLMADTYLTYQRYGGQEFQTHLIFEDDGSLGILREDGVSGGNYEQYGIFFKAECSGFNKEGDIACWSYIGFFIQSLIFGFENSYLTCDSKVVVLRSIFWGYLLY